MTSEPKLQRRHQIVVDRAIQVRLVARLTGAFAVSLCFFVAVSLGIPPLFGALSGSSEWGLAELAYRVRSLLGFVCLPLLSALLVLFACGVRETARLAGPLYRWRQVFSDLRRLRIPRGVQVRSDDHLQDGTAEFHTSLVALHDEIERLTRQSVTGRAELTRVLRDRPELIESLRGLDDSLDAVHRGLEGFTLLPAAPYREPGPAPVEPSTEPALSTAG